MKHTDPPIVVSQDFPLPVERVWRAITDRDEMIQWFFEEIPAFAARAGFTTGFDVVAESRTFPHVWKIVEAEAPRRLVVDWSYEGLAGRGLVAWDLAETDGGCRLTLTNRVIEDFAPGIPEFTTTACRGGWEYFLNGRLRAYLKANP